MKNSVVQQDVDEFSSVLTGLGTQPSLHSTSQEAFAHFADAPLAPAKPAHSYQPYSWPLANRALDLVDVWTKGRAGLFQRVVSYLFFGGVAALVNLLVFYIMDYHVLAAYTAQHQFIGRTLSYIVASELSILANFIPNDRFTFSKLPGAQRPWMQRCLRFHATCIVGTGLTYMIMMLLTNFAHVPSIFSEAIATLIVLIYNFSFHHIFTYRHIKHA